VPDADADAASLASALRVLATEAAALALLSSFHASPPTEQRVVDLLARAHARGGTVVLCSVGKSGLVPRKMAATLLSRGLPPRIVHGGDAAHGDLGAPMHEREETNFGVRTRTTSSTVAIALGDMLALEAAERVQGRGTACVFVGAKPPWRRDRRGCRGRAYCEDGGPYRVARGGTHPRRSRFASKSEARTRRDQVPVRVRHVECCHVCCDYWIDCVYMLRQTQRPAPPVQCSSL
jgi:hypothetical protein